MRSENKNWTFLSKKVLRFGDLSHHQRKVKDIPISYTEAYLKCERCDHELLVVKRKSESGEYGWDLKKWQAVLRKSQVLKDETGYLVQSRIEFYCSCPECQG
jgi:hypothetical protein